MAKNPEVTFGTFILSVAQSAMVELKNEKPSIELVRQSIELLELLEVKTKNNLTTEEERILKTLLYELRVGYMDVQK